MLYPCAIIPVHEFIFSAEIFEDLEFYFCRNTIAWSGALPIHSLQTKSDLCRSSQFLLYPFNLPTLFPYIFFNLVVSLLITQRKRKYLGQETPTENISREN